MKDIRRSVWGEHVTLSVTFSGEPGWNTHTVSCSEVEVKNEGPLFIKPPSVRINPLSFSRGTPDELRQHALELLRLADIAEDLEAEMREIYATKWMKEVPQEQVEA